jgi:hypothetical protein
MNAFSASPGAQGGLALHADAGPDGTFTIQNVPPGSYTLTAALSYDIGVNDAISGSFSVPRAAQREQMLNRLPERAVMQLTVTSESVSGIALQTRRGGRVTGRYVADTGVTRPLPAGLGVVVRGSVPGIGTMHMTGATASDFELAGLSGPSRVEVEGVPEGWAVKAILLDGQDVTDAAFDLSGKSGTMRVVMTDRPTSLGGTIRSDRDKRDYAVIVFADDPEKWTTPSRFVRTVRADANGHFRFRGLPPGQRYFVAALDYLEDGEDQDRQLLERLRSRATSVVVGDGEQHSVQLDVTVR